ncbi:MAG TPA: hypothetical protein VGK27_02895 [Candidatus Deferrimicrobiaceae bacterium]|jgi:hypothetical protein
MDPEPENAVAPPARLFVRRLSRPALLLHLALLGGLIALTARVFPAYGLFDAILVGAAPYVCYSAVVRPLLTRRHRAGIRLLRAGRFDDAVRAFEDSRDYFTRHPALDRYRFLILMSAGAASYRELAMGDIAYAHARAGHRAAAREACEQALAAFPGCAVARFVLETLPPGA